MMMRNIDNILCPMDVERPSQAALRYAFFLAEAFYASLDVVHAQKTPTSNSQRGPRSAERSAEPSVGERVTRDRLEDLLQRVTTAVPGRASAHVVEGGPLSGILRSALRFRSDLIVVGSCFDAESGWLFGADLGEQIAYAAACPVLSVPERVPPSALRVRRILVPVALGRSAALAVRWTTAFAHCFGATVELLNVRRESGDASIPGSQHAELDELHDMLRVAGVAVEAAGPRESGAFEQILERTESGRCDLVVMAAEPRNRRMSVTQPSLIASVRRHASIPILSVRAPGSEIVVRDRGLSQGRSDGDRGASRALV